MFLNWEQDVPTSSFAGADKLLSSHLQLTVTLESSLEVSVH